MMWVMKLKKMNTKLYCYSLTNAKITGDILLSSVILLFLHTSDWKLGWSFYVTKFMNNFLKSGKGCLINIVINEYVSA